jgi:hypothetical protein
MPRFIRANSSTTTALACPGLESVDDFLALAEMTAARRFRL